MKHGNGIPGMYIELIPGANHYVMIPAEEKKGPPAGFVDNTVYRYRLKPDGTKELIGTMEAYPEGWDDPKKYRENPVQRKQKRGEDNMTKARADREEKLKEAKVLIEQGKNLSRVAKELGVPVGTLRRWLKQEEKKRVTEQEPESENQTSNSPESPETDKLAENGIVTSVGLERLVAELREDLDLERKKVAELEKKMEALVSAISASNTGALTPETRLARFVVAVFRELEKEV